MDTLDRLSRGRVNSLIMSIQNVFRESKPLFKFQKKGKEFD